MEDINAGILSGTCRNNILFLYSRCFNYVGAIANYINAFKTHSRHHIIFHDPDNGSMSNLDLSRFDAVIVNYCVISRCHFLPDSFYDSLQSFNGVKVAIVQDEYDNALLHRKSLERMRLTCIITAIPTPEDYYKVYYGKEFAHLDFIPALTGYVTDDMCHMPEPIPMEKRKWMLGYRGRNLHYKYGRLGWEKYIIGKRMAEICQSRNIPANIAVDEDSRIYGSAWVDFIRNCRATLGTESGSNVFDFDNTITPAIVSYMEKHPEADFETVFALFLKDYEGNVKMNQISSRIFEAASLWTALVLFEGEYSGIVKPWKHFIPLKKDFSNVDEVFAALNNIPLLEKMTKETYEDVILSGKYSYATFIRKIDDYISSKTKESGAFEPVFFLGGWRDMHGKIHKTFESGLMGPTFDMLKNSDIVSVPIFKFYIDWHALACRVIATVKLYAAKFGIMKLLRANKRIFSICRKLFMMIMRKL